MSQQKHEGLRINFVPDERNSDFNKWKAVANSKCNSNGKICL